MIRGTGRPPEEDDEGEQQQDQEPDQEQDQEQEEREEQDVYSDITVTKCGGLLEVSQDHQKKKFIFPPKNCYSEPHDRLPEVGSRDRRAGHPRSNC